MTLEFEWPISFDSDRDCSALDEVEDREQYEKLAVQFLSNWTDNRFGLRTSFYRPSGPKCFAPSTFQGRGPVSTLGAPARTRKVSRTAIPLKHPQSVVSVKIDGEILMPSAYVLEGDTLYRVDGDYWPLSQNLDKPTSMPGTFEIEYIKGLNVPEGGQLAAGILACEFAKAAMGDANCQLPERVTSITRQGVSVAVMDQFEDLEKGHTGIWLVDSWVVSVTAPKKASTVLSPESRRANA